MTHSQGSIDSRPVYIMLRCVGVKYVTRESAARVLFFEYRFNRKLLDIGSGILELIFQRICAANWLEYFCGTTTNENKWTNKQTEQAEYISRSETDKINSVHFYLVLIWKTVWTHPPRSSPVVHFILHQRSTAQSISQSIKKLVIQIQRVYTIVKWI